MSVFDPRRPPPPLRPKAFGDYPSPVRRLVKDVEKYRRQNRADPPWSEEARLSAACHAMSAYNLIRYTPEAGRVLATSLSPQVGRALSWGLEDAKSDLEQLEHALPDPRTSEVDGALYRLHAFLESLSRAKALGEEASAGVIRVDHPRAREAKFQVQSLCRYFQINRSKRGIVVRLISRAQDEAQGTGAVQKSIRSLMDQTKGERVSWWAGDPEANRCERCGELWWGNTHQCALAGRDKSD